MNIQTNLFDFAFVPAWLEQLDELAGMTLPEPWSFVSPSKTGINTYTPILERYINTVFHKQALAYIFAQDAVSADREFYIRNEFSCFHTGLFTKRYDGIYMCFERNKRKDSLLEWYFKGWADKSSPLLRYVSPLPERPAYDQKASTLAFHPEWEIRMNTEHITSRHEPDFEALARGVLKRVGLLNTGLYSVTGLISKQSPDIAKGVDSGGAGDQGIVYGYATDETPELMPLPFMVATHALEILRRIDFPYLRPDAKAQVTFDYEKRRIDTFLISCQHREDVPMEALRIIIGCAMIAAAARYGLNRDFKMLINPTGSFVVGGSFADTGVTGRKIIADSYGGVCRHGGGAFSGKDPTKIDRSGAYMARKIARDIVAADNAHRCEVQIAYAIGVAEPVAVSVNTFGTGKFSDDVLADLVKAKHDLTPRGIIEQLHLKDVDYNAVSAYGHFGKGHLPWEQ